MKTAFSGILGFFLVGLVLPVCSQSTVRTNFSVRQPVVSTQVIVETGARTLLRPKVQSLNGRWKGQLVIPGHLLSLSLDITQKDGQTTTTLDAPATLLNHHQLLFTQQHDTLRFYDPAAQASFTGTRSADGSQLVGQWQQVGFSQKMALSYELPAAPTRTTRTTKWSSGTLENNHPVGTWQYFRPNAKGQLELAQVYDHSSGQVLFSSTDSLRYNVELTPGQWIKSMLTESPWFIGGVEALSPYISKLQYPALAQQRHIEGIVTVGFTIDSQGQASDFTVIRRLGNGCDEEALRVARTIPSTWTPARVGNEAVTVRHSISFDFRMP